MKRLLLLSVLSIFCLTISAQTYIPVTNPDPAYLTYTFQGGSFESYGCSGVDPAFWLSENGISLTVNFVNPEQNPSVRVWGMNDDDTAAFMVNGSTYPLNSSSAYYDPKVICNAIGSPGPDGVLFSEGILVGANSNSQGNYSYQDVTIIGEAVTSITVTGLSGLGWGIGGVTVDNPLGIDSIMPKSVIEIFPNPTNGNFTIELGKEYKDITIQISNILGQIISSEEYASAKTIQKEITGPAGVYFVEVNTAREGSNTLRVVKQ
jgi:hypothetical protein